MYIKSYSKLILRMNISPRHFQVAYSPQFCPHLQKQQRSTSFQTSEPIEVLKLKENQFNLSWIDLSTTFNKIALKPIIHQLIT